MAFLFFDKILKEIIMKYISLLLYYGFAQFLPASTNRYFMWCRSIRRFFAARCFDKCGKDVNIEKGAKFGMGTGVIIGDGSGIGVNCSIHGPLTIGDNVMMGPDVVILTSNHNFANIDIPMSKQGFSLKPVVIGNDVWIGTRSIILPGVTVGNGVVIGAGAVVIRSITEKGKYIGVPVRKVNGV